MAWNEFRGENGKQRCDCECHPDFSWASFGPGKINVSDVDCLFVVERKGEFLFIEAKRPHETLSKGQKILIEQLSRIPSFTAWLVKMTRDSIPISIQPCAEGRWGDIQTSSREDFQARVDEWYKAAEYSL